MSARVEPGGEIGVSGLDIEAARTGDARQLPGAAARHDDEELGAAVGARRGRRMPEGKRARAAVERPKDSMAR
nr:hypothetical protein [Nocardia acidivorans]